MHILRVSECECGVSRYRKIFFFLCRLYCFLLWASGGGWSWSPMLRHRRSSAANFEGIYLTVSIAFICIIGTYTTYTFLLCHVLWPDIIYIVADIKQLCESLRGGSGKTFSWIDTICLEHYRYLILDFLVLTIFIFTLRICGILGVLFYGSFNFFFDKYLEE